MTYEVLARKWRPQRFADVVGQEHVTRTLGNAITARRLAHAYLFVGPRGIGKTSIARIFARALNCAAGPTAEPCGACDSCREIAAGTNLDVLEIDGASNNGIEQVRDLRDNVRFAPTRGPFKIYIIDEVHMLSVSAFNALLKTLEEPPKHVKFIFATTEPQKVPATVLSRCQRFDLRRIPVSLIVERLRLVAEAEKVTVEPDALLAIARGAEGGLRDAESALDQLIAFRGEHIAEADVLSVFGLVSRVHLDTLAAAVLAGDVPALLRVVSELDAAGKDLQRLVVELMEHFRNLLVLLNVDDAALLTEVTEAQLAALREQASLTSAGRVLRVLQVLAEAEDRMKFALSRRTLLETALIRGARAATVVTIDEVLTQIAALREQLEAAGPAAAAAAAAPVAAPAAPSAVAPRASAPPPVATARAAAPAARTVAVGAADHDDAELARLQAYWPRVIEQMARKAVQAKGVLVDARPVRVGPRVVVLGFDSEFPEEKARFETGRDRKALELTLGSFLKRPVTVEFTLVAGGLDAPAAPAAAAPAEPAVAEAQAGALRAPAAAAAPAATVPDEPAPRPVRLPSEWRDDAAVRKTLELFNGTIVDVRD